MSSGHVTWEDRAQGLRPLLAQGKVGLDAPGGTAKPWVPGAMHHDDQGQCPGPLLLAAHRAGFLGPRLCCGSTQRCRVSPRITRLDPRVTCQLAHWRDPVTSAPVTVLPATPPTPRELTRAHPVVAQALGGCPSTRARCGSSEPRHLEREGQSPAVVNRKPCGGEAGAQERSLQQNWSPWAQAPESWALCSPRLSPGKGLSSHLLAKPSVGLTCFLSLLPATAVLRSPITLFSPRLLVSLAVQPSKTLWFPEVPIPAQRAVATFCPTQPCLTLGGSEESPRPRGGDPHTSAASSPQSVLALTCPSGRSSLSPFLLPPTVQTWECFPQPIFSHVVSCQTQPVTNARCQGFPTPSTGPASYSGRHLPRESSQLSLTRCFEAAYHGLQWWAPPAPHPHPATGLCPVS